MSVPYQQRFYLRQSLKQLGSPPHRSVSLRASSEAFQVAQGPQPMLCAQGILSLRVVAIHPRLCCCSKCLQDYALHSCLPVLLVAFSLQKSLREGDSAWVTRSQRRRGIGCYL